MKQEYLKSITYESLIVAYLQLKKNKSKLNNKWLL